MSTGLLVNLSKLEELPNEPNPDARVYNVDEFGIWDNGDDPPLCDDCDNYEDECTCEDYEHDFDCECNDCYESRGEDDDFEDDREERNHFTFPLPGVEYTVTSGSTITFTTSVTIQE